MGHKEEEKTYSFKIAVLTRETWEVKAPTLSAALEMIAGGQANIVFLDDPRILPEAGAGGVISVEESTDGEIWRAIPVQELEIAVLSSSLAAPVQTIDELARRIMAGATQDEDVHVGEELAASSWGAPEEESEKE